jgi:predicted flap endonuclease-1-like 5' DNA nuclease
MQHRLNQAGITTYAQLARSTADELRQALGEVARLAKVEQWIEQAQEVTGRG